ncbi:RrF2 family transcriptional regulator [Marinobacter confluentis]|uniref:Rrf2 family transcriptional regulator n=1 Tax=Marinobacter confluentis TaxID=1697557 RepID=A0A4Z1CI39_9GAMM|nr:Rrf2 family transcriptional regulator [Marinobacter confluentis]TGN40402.1 Rrf2 family transcriptional regulator [Marinobacter confluentis]
MHITRYTDYSLRVLIYLATRDNELSTIQQIADSYDISRNHLMKVVHQLNKKGYIETIRGKKGGMKLRMHPGDINIGVLVRETEQDLSVVECLSGNNGCRIAPVCGLKGMFNEAVEAFLKTLDQYTLQDVIPEAHRAQLLRLLQIA